MTARYYITNASQRYHIVADLPPHRWHEGGPVLCGRRVRSYGTPEPIERARGLLQSPHMCAACRRAYEKRLAAMQGVAA